MKKFLTTSDGPSYKIIGRWVEISDDGLIDGETPIEDYEFWMLTDSIIPGEHAWKVWMAEIDS